MAGCLSHFPEANRSVLRSSRWQTFLVCFAVLATSWLAADAAAQSKASGSLLLVSDADVASSLERSVKRRLGQVADVLSAHAYESAVRSAGMSPGSDAALSKLGPRAGAALIVHLAMDARGELRAEVRDGKTGAVRSTLEFPLQGQGRRFKRPSRALRELVASIREAQGSSAPIATNEDEELDDDPAPAAESAAAPSSNPPAEVAARPQSSGDEQVMDDPELRERLAVSTSERDAGPRQGLGLQASVGVGPGSHTLDIPAPNGRGALETGVAPAVELAAAAELGLGQWLFRAEGQYRTFFGASPAPLPSDVNNVSGMMPAQTAQAPLTSHSFIIGASPGYRFGGRNSVALLLMLGWTYRSLQASVPTLPSASLTGVVARPTLYIPFGDVFCLRLAPELIIVQNSETNASAGGVTTTDRATGGTGFGVEAALDVKLAKLLGAALQFRRSRVAAARGIGDPAIDQEWYVSVQAVLSL